MTNGLLQVIARVSGIIREDEVLLRHWLKSLEDMVDAGFV